MTFICFFKSSLNTRRFEKRQGAFNKTIMIEIRKVEKKEKDEAIKTACDIFFEEQDVPKELTDIKTELSPVWWGAFSDKELVGTVAAYKKDGVRHMGRLTVRKNMRGRHLATELVKTVLKELFESGEPEVRLDAREATKRIILSFGGEVTGEEYRFFKSTCVPVRITKEQFETNNR